MSRNNLFYLFAVVSLMFSAKSSAQVTMDIDAQQRGPMVSDYQYGLFFEEINHAGEGGLYAELVNNRSFENSDEPEHWKKVGGGVTMNVTTKDLLNSAQHHALDVKVGGASKMFPQGIANEGYWGMSFKKDSTYTLTFFVKSLDGKAARNITARLVSADGKTLCGEVKVLGKLNKNGWTKLSAKIKATATTPTGQLQLLASADGEMLIDVVSLFPYTWKNRPNGLRPDLAQLLADTHPRFLRFPGGCYVEGIKTFNNAFQWKKSIGPIEQRPGHKDANWGYYSSDGLGFDEYLQLCNDMGAQPLFVVNVGLGHGFTIPLADVDTLVQNTLDAIEYANGDASTKWGARRIANGHKEPYGLKFIEIGNENYQTSGLESQDYPERYYKFYKAIKERFPYIIRIGNVEAWDTDTPSWRNSHPVDVVDEHYYRSYEWMLNNYDKYDTYPRQPKVYVGEYAANAGGSYGKYGDVNSALGEAVFMLGMEKNSDVCLMGSFAPIFTHEKDPFWPYDMIHFNSAKNFCTPSYYVQKMMGENTAGQNVKFTVSNNLLVEERRPEAAGLATWLTGSTYRDFTVTDNVTKKVYKMDGKWTDLSGKWTSSSNERAQTDLSENCRSVLNNFISSGHYTVNVKARKDNGPEGFIVIYSYKDAKNFSWWNVGGWTNTSNGIEIFNDGGKAPVTQTDGKVETGRWYDLKVQVDLDTVKCYLDGVLTNQYVKKHRSKIYPSVQIDDAKKQMVLKVVNPLAEPMDLKINLKNVNIADGNVVRLTSAHGSDENTMEQPFNVVPSKPEKVVNANVLTLPPFSLNIYRWDIK